MKMKVFTMLLCLISTLQSFSQIVSKDGTKLKNKKTKPVTYAFLEFNRTSSFRGLTENKEFITYPLGERANEQPLKIWSYFLGMNTGLTNFLRFEGGISYLQNGEQYSYQGPLGSDSTFSYQTKYKYIAMPCQLKVEFGNSFRFSLGAGIMPQLFNGYRQDQQWTTETGSKNEKTIKDNTTCNSFGLSVISSAGVHYVGMKSWGLFLKVNYRQQLTNTLTKYGDYVHFSKGLGYSIGISKNLE